MNDPMRHGAGGTSWDSFAWPSPSQRLDCCSRLVPAWSAQSITGPELQRHRPSRKRPRRLEERPTERRRTSRPMVEGL